MAYKEVSGDCMVRRVLRKLLAASTVVAGLSPEYSSAAIPVRSRSVLYHAVTTECAVSTPESAPLKTFEQQLACWPPE